MAIGTTARPHPSASGPLDHLRGFVRLSDRVAHPPLVFTGGNGVWVHDESGRPYLEAAAGMWCAAFGFSEGELVEAAVEQLQALPYYHTLLNRTHGPAEELAHLLVSIVPMPAAQIHFTVSGSEAADFAVKFLRYASNASGRTAKKKVIARDGGYHGATLGATSLTGMDRYHQLFDLPLPGFLHTMEPHFYRHAAPGETEAEFAARLVRALDELVATEGPETVAGFVAEPVTGGGGVVIPPTGYYAAVQEVLHRYDVAFVADEIITGFGRTGAMFGCESLGIRPDVMTMGKGMSGGYLPIAAVAVSGRLAEQISAGSDAVGTFAHGATHSGNPVAAAVAVRAIRLMEERALLTHVEQVAPLFAARIDRLLDRPCVADVRHIGLMGAVELMADPSARIAFEPWGSVAARVSAAALRHGLLLRTAARGDVITFSPPLVIDAGEVDELFDRFEAALDDVESELAAGR